MNDIPVLEAFERNEQGDLSIYCVFCQEHHHHGQGDGHRIAHCTNEDSPFIKTGYIIKRTFVRVDNA